jgi:predicted Zn-dependent protease
MRAGRLRAAVTIHSAASSGVSAGSPAQARVGAIMAVATSG